MKVNWKQILNIKDFVLKVFQKEASDIPVKKIQSKDWVEAELDIKNIKVDHSLIRKHNLEKLHITKGELHRVGQADLSLNSFR